MRKSRLLIGLVVVLAVAGTAYLGYRFLRPAPSRPHLVLVTIDTLRRDHVSCYVEGKARTPAIDDIAARGVRFDAASAACPLTLPSHASMLTGLRPCRHGLRDNLGHALPKRSARSFPTLAELLADAGYETAAFVSGATLDAALGLDAGFAHYEDPEPGGGDGIVRLAERTAAQTNDAVRAWLEGAGTDRPLFLWVHYFDPHAPYEPPFPFDGGETEAERYAGEVASTDDRLRELLALLETRGLLENTVVAVLSDHGEGLGDHGERTHGHLLYESTLAIPFLLAGPGVPEGAVVADPVRTTDLLPTVLGLLGLRVPADRDGRDLRPVWEGTDEDVPPAYAESLYAYRECGWAQQSALRVESLKLLDAGPRLELYDLTADPGEARDLAEEDPERAKAMASALRRIRETPPPATATPDVLPAGPYGVAASARTRTFLSPRANAALRAPADRMGIVARLDRARNLFARGSFEEAQDVLDAVVALEPANPSARFWLAYVTLKRAFAASRAGRVEATTLFRRAADEAGEAMDLGFRSGAVRDLRMTALARAGRRAEAEALLAETREDLPPGSRTWLAAAQARLLDGDHAGALAAVRAALATGEAGPEAARALQTLAHADFGAPEAVRTEASDLLRSLEESR